MSALGKGLGISLKTTAEEVQNPMEDLLLSLLRICATNLFCETIRERPGDRPGKRPGNRLGCLDAHGHGLQPKNTRFLTTTPEKLILVDQPLKSVQSRT